MPTKDRLLVLLQTLQNNSDDEIWLTTADLRPVLEKEGYECSVRTLRRDMQSLHNCGYDIAVQETEGMFTRYAYLGRKWSMPDLQILAVGVPVCGEDEYCVPGVRERGVCGVSGRSAG